MRTRTNAVLAAAIVAVMTVAGCGSAREQGETSAPKESASADVTSERAVHHDLSSPLISATPAKYVERGEAARERRLEGEAEREREREGGRDKEDKDKPGAKREEVLPHPAGNGGKDPVAQTALKAPSTAPVSGPSAPTAGAGFDTVGNGFTGPQGTFTVKSAPPDINSDVSATQVFTTVNTSFSVQSKTGTVLYGPAANNTVFKGFGGACETTNDGDAVIRFDDLAGRWVFTQFANVASTAGPYYECVAVSTTADATGTWNRYAFQYADFPDYPKLSVWPDAYYVTYNVFAGNTFKGAKSCAMDRAAMLAGTAATQQCFSTTTSYGGLLPADLDGTTLPPAGAPNVQVSLGTTSTTLAYWKFHVDWTTPANTTFTGPTPLTVASYSPACSGGTCIAQSGTTNKLDSLADRLMFRLAYRNIGGTESLVVTHSVTSGTNVGMRWYELRLSGGNPTVYQQGTYAPDATSRWMGSAAMDKAGNLAMGYATSSSTSFPSIKYTGRLAGDTLGTMTQGENVIVNGAGSQTGTLTRWGDYSSMSLDPTDDCTFWFSHEYLGASGSFNWKTRIGSFTLPGCTAPLNTASVSASPTSASVVAGSSASTTLSTAVVSGGTESLTLSAAGLPAGATASFSPTSVTTGGSSAMTVATTSATPAGTYAVTVSATGASGTATTSFSLTVTAPVTTTTTTSSTTTSSTTTTTSSTCTSPGQKILNPGFESGTTSWTATSNTIGKWTAEPPRTGLYDMWLGGNGKKVTEYGQQSIVIPAGCSTYTLSFWLHVDSAETTTTTAYDKLTVTLGTTTLATYSNLNKATGYVQKTFNVSSAKGTTKVLKFNSVEDASNQTSFVIDDTALTVG